MLMSIRRRAMARLARRNAERRLAVFGCIRLFGCAMKRVFPQKWIVFLFLEPVRRARTLFVPRGHVTRSRFAQRFRFGALEGDNFLSHVRYSFDSGAASLQILLLRLRRLRRRSNRRATSPIAG